MEELESILSGRVCHQPAHQKGVPTGSVLRQIRLFICSTYHDFIKERELLWLRVLPELQQHCTQYGVDILFFDPYRQSNGDFVYDPILCEDVKQHFKKLKRESGGPYFLCLLGDKYGPCPIPFSLKGEEFQHIKQSFFENGGDVKILDESYRLNENNGSQYDLQPKMNEYVSLLFSRSRSKFDIETHRQLQDAIQKGARLAHAGGLINQTMEDEMCINFIREQVEEMANQYFIKRKG
uniref:DUF4062 domain-containing protein n=1 Tax=Romanomermis culicivorax TaxID=13658 RepID=A0A915HV75_ROMCU